MGWQNISLYHLPALDSVHEKLTFNSNTVANSVSEGVAIACIVNDTASYNIDARSS